jgi:hypothetical protein
VALAAALHTLLYDPQAQLFLLNCNVLDFDFAVLVSMSARKSDASSNSMSLIFKFKLWSVDSRDFHFLGTGELLN